MLVGWIRTDLFSHLPCFIWKSFYRSVFKVIHVQILKHTLQIPLLTIACLICRKHPLHIGYTPHFVHKYVKQLHITDTAGKLEEWLLTQDSHFYSKRVRRVVHSLTFSIQRTGILWLFLLSLGNSQLVVAINSCLLGR